MSAVTSVQVERVEIDPRQLLTDLNIRLDTRLDDEFVESIKQHGVLMPIIAVRTTDGQLRVRFGHRRTAAAIKVGRTTVPVDVVGDEGSDDAAQIERVITQHAENAHRAGLTPADELNVVEQLTAFGVSASQINKRTRIKRASVDAALVVSSSALAKKAAERYDFLSLDQAAAVAEFDDDDEAVKTLVVAAKDGGFDHLVQRLRDDRADAIAQRVILDQLSEAGVAVIEHPKWGSAEKTLGNLGTDENPMTVEAHASCPGHPAYLAEVWTDEDDEEEDENAELVWQAIYVCTDPVGNGHIEPTESRRHVVEKTEADHEAEREARRQVIANNKAWRSAEAVRREWLAKFLERKTAPKDAQRFILTAIAQGDSELTKAMEAGHAFAADMLGIGLQTNVYRIDPTPIVDALAGATDGRAVVIALGLVLGAYEVSTHSNCWRYRQVSVRRYFEAIERWGYVLSDVELLAAGREVAEVEA